MSTEIRWQQRFRNYQSSLAALRRGCAQTEYSELEQAGLIQLCKVTFELAWKTLKDLLEYGGFTIRSPRETLKQAFASGYLSDGEGWIRALDGRHRLSHIYGEEMAETAVGAIKDSYLPLLAELETTLARELSGNA